MKPVILNRAGFEIEFPPNFDKPNYPFTCKDCGKGTWTLVKMRLGDFELEVCPQCYNNFITEMNILGQVGWNEPSWYPSDEDVTSSWRFKLALKIDSIRSKFYNARKSIKKWWKRRKLMASFWLRDHGFKKVKVDDMQV